MSGEAAAWAFAVMAERCDQCLFGPDKVVSDERRAEILRKIRSEDGWFICHKASIAGVDAACRGDWDRNGCGQVGRVMGRLGAVRFVAEADLGSLPTARRHDGGDET